jgi:hypothetical protein
MKAYEETLSNLEFALIKAFEEANYEVQQNGYYGIEEKDFDRMVLSAKEAMSFRKIPVRQDAGLMKMMEEVA